MTEIERTSETCGVKVEYTTGIQGGLVELRAGTTLDYKEFREVAREMLRISDQIEAETP